MVSPPHRITLQTLTNKQIPLTKGSDQPLSGGIGDPIQEPTTSQSITKTSNTRFEVLQPISRN